MPTHGSRRFHEAGVGSRTGLRLSAVARDEDGFEDLDAFYRASQAAMDHGGASELHDDDDDDDDASDSDSYDDDERSADLTTRSGATARAGKRSGGPNSSMDLQNSSMPSPRSTLRRQGHDAASSPYARSNAAGPSSARLTASPRGKFNGRASLTIADDFDHHDYGLHDASDGSRSFDLLAMAGDDAAAMESDNDEMLKAPSTSLAPSKGLSARKTTGRANKGKAVASRHDYLDDSDADEYDVPAYVPDDDFDDNTNAYAVQPAPNAKTKARSKTDKLTTATKATKAKPKSTRPASPMEAPYRHPSPSRRAQPTKKKSRQVEAEYDELNVDASLSVAPKAKKSTAPASKRAKTLSSSQRSKERSEVVHSQLQSSMLDKDGLRRSTRQKFEPLEYWRGERIRYGRPSLPKGVTPADLRRGLTPAGDDDGVEEVLFRRRVPVLDIKEVIRVPRAPGEGTFADNKRIKAIARRSRPKKEDRQTGSLEPEDDYYPLIDPKADTIQAEDGWDEQTVASGLVIDHDTGQEVEKVIVRTKASLQPTMMHPYEFKFEKVFTFGGQMGVGVLHLGPGKRKDTKANKDDFVFTVMQGALRVQVHRKICTVGPGGIFHVPAGNNYSLKNICERDVHLFVASARVARKSESNDLTMFSQASDTSYSTPGMTRTLLDRRRSVVSPAPARYPVLHQQEAEDRDDTDDEQDESPVPVLSPVKRASTATATADEDEDDFQVSRTLKTKRKFRKIG